MERDMEIQVAKLSASLEGLSREILRRMDHQDVTLSSILVQARETNGRVTRSEEQIKALQKTSDGFTARDKVLSDEADKHLTLGDLKWYLFVAAGAFGAGWGLFERFGR
jgi:hypothetical protein